MRNLKNCNVEYVRFPFRKYFEQLRNDKRASYIGVSVVIQLQMHLEIGL